jgi:hypothetical protein
MHFGLYAFDVFLEIYREAWDWEKEKWPRMRWTSGRRRQSAHLKPFLDQTYADQDSLCE